MPSFLALPQLGYIMTCSLHCDDNSAGYYQRGMRECLTIFCDMPVVVMVVYTDFVYDKVGKPLLVIRAGCSSSCL